jgi:hypothetical protein
MTTVLWLLAVQGAIGAFDTLYFHEWRARLVARGPSVHGELRLHAARSFIYAIIFAGLALFAWKGALTGVLIALLIAEIVITMADFVIEDRARKALGGLYPGERITHAVMGIVYGAMLAFLSPLLIPWIQEPAGLAASVDAPVALKGVVIAMAVGVFLSAVRDLAATFAVAWARYPWPEVRSESN